MLDRRVALLALLAPAVVAAACTEETSPSGLRSQGTDAGFTASESDAASPAPTATATATPTADAAPEAAAPCPIAEDATIAAKVILTADDKKALYVNGQLVVNDTVNLWSSPTTHDVTLFVRPGKKNVIAVLASNEAEIDGRDRGLLFDLSFGPDGGTPKHVVSDATWRVSSTESAGWFDVAFDDSGFKAAVDQGKVGIGPWGAIGNFDANAGWIWAYDSSVTAAEKPDPPEKLFARKTFWFDAQGNLSATPTTCP